MPRHAFTLIELLIVVAIIAILAAIAVPNFTEAQTRAKMGRLLGDARTIAAALASYRVDNNNRLPESDWAAATSSSGAGLHRLTTPIADVTAIPRSPFNENTLLEGRGERHAQADKTLLYQRARPSGAGVPGIESDENKNGLEDGYEGARQAYLVEVFLGVQTNSPERECHTEVSGRIFTMADVPKGEWLMRSVGPDGDDDYRSATEAARVYSANNGTLSDGDVVVFSDFNPYGQ